MINYDYSDFLPLHELVKKKKTAGSLISVVIPTRNEASTIGNIINTTKRDLMEETTLVDEIIVIDNNSIDATVSIAREAGALVLSADSIPSPCGPVYGKGAALWKSQFVVHGDILVCIDADIKNFNTRFIYGLIGPFFQSKQTIFVKAYYRRPLVIDDHVYESYGGRVTEILVRPMLSAFIPDLAAVYQPLSGEYAFRREPIEMVSFSSGYGVEIGMIFDLYKKYGLDCFAQVDMDVRYHRNRPVTELGEMAFGILHTLIKKLEREKMLTLHVPYQEKMISHGPKGLAHSTFTEIELPPKAQFESAVFRSEERNA